jgi:hypothetical protein
MFPQRPADPPSFKGDRSRLEVRHTIPLSAGRTFQVVRLGHYDADEAVVRDHRPLLRILGTSVCMIERHYGALLDGAVHTGGNTTSNWAPRPVTRAWRFERSVEC